MEYKTTCPVCQATFLVAAEEAISTITCPKCDSSFRAKIITPIDETGCKSEAILQAVLDGPMHAKSDRPSSAPKEAPHTLDTKSVWIFGSLFVLTVVHSPICGIVGCLIGILVTPHRGGHNIDISRTALVISAIGLFLPFLFSGIYLCSKYGSSCWPFALAVGFTAICGIAGFFIGATLDPPAQGLPYAVLGSIIGAVAGFVLSFFLLMVIFGDWSRKHPEPPASPPE